MPTVTLPDDSKLKFDQPVTAAEVASAIGPGLGKAALAAKVDDRTNGNLRRWEQCLNRLGH